MSVRFLADENLNREIVTGLLRLVEDIDIVRVQDVGLRTVDDPVILQWAAAEGRVLVTHDIATVPDFASQAEEHKSPGISLRKKHRIW